MKEKDIQKLIKAGIIDQLTADQMTAFFENEKKESGNLILILFAAIGALLLGGGIILILAHNWDRMPESLRVIVALLPLIFAQILSGYTLFKKYDSLAWREAAGILNFLAIGATIATLGQIFHLPSDTPSFIRTWILTGFPVIYILRSHTVGIILLIFIFCYLVYYKNPGEIRYWHWIFIALAVPFYYQSYIGDSKSRVQLAYNWLFSLLIVFSLIFTYPGSENINFLMLAILTGVYYALSKFLSKEYHNTAYNSWYHLSQIGTLILCYIFAFKDYWKNFLIQHMPWHFWIFLIIPVLFIAYRWLKQLPSLRDLVEPPHHFWILAVLSYFFDPGHYFLFAFFNVLLLLYGIYYMYHGIKKDNLYQTNIGLFAIIILIITRFFDIDMSFMMRGVVFIVLAICFFAVNYYLIKTRKS